VTVLVGITAAYAVTNAISVIVGGLLGAALPSTAISIAGGLAFLGFAVWTLLGDDGPEDDDGAVPSVSSAALVSVIVAMVVAELGDKTMLATATLAARDHPLAVWVGATLGITASGTIAVLVGRLIGDRLPKRTIRFGAAALFAVFGLVLLADAQR
jgi:putative Ca2+/H+ antiporter (TMEM165/GDT1 family)